MTKTTEVNLEEDDEFEEEILNDIRLAKLYSGGKLHSIKNAIKK